MPRIASQLAQQGRETRPHGLFTGGQLSSMLASTRAPVVRYRPVLGNIPPVFGTAQGRNFERSLRMIDDNMERREAYNNALWVHEQSTKAKKQWMQWMNDEQNNTDTDITARFREQYQEYMAEAAEKAQNPRARAALVSELDSLGIKMLGQSMHLEARNRSQESIVRLNALVRDASDVIALSSTPKIDLKEQQNQLRDNVASAQASGKITRRMADSFRDSINNLSAEAVDYLTTKDPQLAQEILDESKHIPMNIRAALTRRIQAANKKHDSLFRAEQVELLKNHVALIQDTGQGSPLWSEQVFKSATSAGATYDAKVKIAQAHKYFAAKSEMEGGNPAEIAATLSKFAPGPKKSKNYLRDRESFVDLSRLARSKIKQFNEDPFTWALQDSTLKEQAEGLSKADPSTQAVLLDRMIDNNLAHQAAGGVPDGLRTVAPLDTLKEISSSLNNAEPQQVVARLQELNGKYGKHFPRLIGNLSSLTGDHQVDTVIQLAALNMGRPWVTDFINATRIPDSDFTVSPEARNDIKNKVSSAEGLVDLQESLTATSSNPERIKYAADFSEAVRKQAMLHASRGMSVSKAVKKAGEQLISENFAFGDSGGKVYTISRQYVSKDGRLETFSGQDLDKIRRMLDMELERTELPVFAPRARKPGGKFEKYKGIDPKTIDMARLGYDERTDPMDLMYQNLFWATSEDMAGVTLFAPGVAGNAKRVFDTEGRPFKISFEGALRKYETWEVDQMEKFDPVEEAIFLGMR